MLAKAVCGAKLGAEIFMLLGHQQRENVSPKEKRPPPPTPGDFYDRGLECGKWKKKVFVLGCSIAVGNIAKIFPHCTKSNQTSLILALVVY